MINKKMIKTKPSDLRALTEDPGSRNFFKDFWTARLRLIEKHLRYVFSKKVSAYNSILQTAMSYSVMSGGKRLRPVIVLAAAEASGMSPFKNSALLDGACAVELIHTYSLIHDDLPALDNDDYRRGKLSSHKKFGEDMAILAGDALLTMAFELLSRAIMRLKNRLDVSSAADIIGESAVAAGMDGMVGGQVADVKYSSKMLVSKTRQQGEEGGIAEPSRKKNFLSRYRRILDYIHLNKTARLIELSSVLGGLLAGAADRRKIALREYGRKIGLAFQITDDLLDDAPDSSDAKNFRLTYPSLYGRDAALKKAGELAREAVRALAVFPRESQAKKFLEQLAAFVVNRKK